MKIASATLTSIVATKNGRRKSLIRNATAPTHTWGATPQNGCAARRSHHHDA
jgi:hypothetical protein